MKKKIARPNGKPRLLAPVPSLDPAALTQPMPGVAALAAQAAQATQPKMNVAHTITSEQRQELIALDQQAARVKIAIANMYLQSLAVEEQLRSMAKQAIDAQNVFQARVQQLADGAGLDTKAAGWMFDFAQGTFSKQA